MDEAGIIDRSRRGPAYLRLLGILLGLTAFFQAYDAAIATVALPDLADSFGVGADAGAAVNQTIVAIGLGALFAVFVATLADRIGRRKILIASTVVFALTTGATAAAGSLGVFQGLQFVARIFLTSAYLVALAVVAEEFPAERRGQGIGLITATSALGVAAALLYPVAADSVLGWRYLYLLGLTPVLIALLMASSLRETERWRSAGQNPRAPGVRRLLAGGRGTEMLQVGGLFFFTNFALLGATTWWAFFARREREFSDFRIGLFLVGAYALSTIGCLVAGRMQDRSGRRRTGSTFLLAGLVFGLLMFRVTATIPLFFAFAGAVFFGLGSSSVLNALAAELFPTESRVTALAVTRSMFGTLGAILGPLIVGAIAGAQNVPAAGVANASVIATLMFIPALVILRSLPETAGRELEDILAADEIPESIELPYAFATRVVQPQVPEPARRQTESPPEPSERRPAGEVRPEDLFPPD